MKTFEKIFLIIVTFVTFKAFGAERVFFIEPQNKANLAKTFHVKMGIEGRKICEAGKEPKDKNCGHHHILIDGKSIAKDQVIPNDPRHLHYGKGQTEADITLPAGKHTLTLQLADYAHRSYGEGLSQTIEVEVK